MEREKQHKLKISDVTPVNSTEVKISKLIRLGDAHNVNSWPDQENKYYLAMGFSKEDVGRLLEIAKDNNLWESEDDVEVWAPVHALRTLAELEAVEVIDDIIGEFEKYGECEWSYEEVPDVIAQLGLGCWTALKEYLAKGEGSQWALVIGLRSLQKLTKKHNKEEEAIVIYEEFLKKGKRTNIVANSVALGYLLDFKSIKSIEIIREAFKKEIIDYDYAGDIEDVEIILGFRSKRETKRRLGEMHKMIEALREPLDYMEEDTPEMPIRREKIGRNEQCPCGSGKKYKKCCIELVG